LWLLQTGGDAGPRPQGGHEGTQAAQEDATTHARTSHAQVSAKAERKSVSCNPTDPSLLQLTDFFYDPNIYRK